MKNNLIPGKRSYAKPAIESKKVKRCGAKTRTGKPCRHVAGWKTSHYGKGRCRLHGGGSEGAPRGNKNALTHGLTVAPLRPSTYPRADEIRKAVDSAFAGKGDLWWARDLLRSQIQFCYDRMWTLQEMQRAERHPSRVFTRTLNEQLERWHTRAATLTRQVPRVMRDVRKLGLEDQDKVFTLLAVPPEGMDFVPFRSGDLPVDTRDEFLRAYAKQLADSGDLDDDTNEGEADEASESN